MLDQQQTLTSGTDERDYNLIQFDKFKTERFTKAVDGQTTTMRLDHTQSSSGNKSERHLAQLNKAVVNEDTGESGMITVNITASCPAWVNKTLVENEVKAIATYIQTTVLSRWLSFES
jgi:hypothetical protein